MSKVIRFDTRTVDLLSPVITKSEGEIIAAALVKLAVCAEHEAPIGPELFELQTQTRLNNSLEVVGFDKAGDVYLVQRPSCSESPTEPFPDMWHVLGTGLEFGDTWDSAAERVRKKFGDQVELRHLRSVPYIGFPLIVHDKPRGPYMLHIAITLIVGVPTNPRGKFFSRSDIPWSNLVESHRTYILRQALAYYDAKKFS